METLELTAECYVHDTTDMCQSPKLESVRLQVRSSSIHIIHGSTSIRFDKALLTKIIEIVHDKIPQSAPHA